MKIRPSAQKIHIISHCITFSRFSLQKLPISMTLQVVEASEQPIFAPSTKYPPPFAGVILRKEKYAYDCPTYDSDYLVLLHRVYHLFMGLK